MRNRGMMNGDGEFVFVQTYEGVERNGYGDGGNDETCNEVIIISDDDSADDDDGDDGGDGDDEEDGEEEDEEEERSAFDIYRQPVMGASTQNLQIFANLFASSLISDTMSSTVATATTATATATTTTTTAAAATTATMTSTTIRTTEPLQSCCICLSNIGRCGGIDLHNSIHSIHISCLMRLLTANNQIFWLGASFRFNCPLCRKPVFGTVMLFS